MIRKRWVAAAAVAVTGMAAPAASAETIYGLTDGNALVTFDSATPGTTSAPLAISGLNAGETIEGIDLRPATLQMYALSSTGRLLRIDTVTGAATPIGAALAAPAAITAAEDYDIDFNPTVDRLRVVSGSEQNFRVNPNNGALVDGDPAAGVQADGNLNPATAATTITGAAYTNNAPASSAFPAAPTTTLFDIDTGTDQLFTQTPPNSGGLTAGKPLGVNLVGDVGFDISTVSTPGTGVPGANTAYVVGRTADMVARLYTLDTTTGAATAVGAVGGTSKVKDIAVAMPLPQIAVLYNPAAPLGAQQIVTVRADRPSVASTPVNVTGTVGNERLVGLDRRPAGGAIYGVSTNRLYTINLATGAATQVPTAGTPFTPALAGDVGIDFNPVPDLLRLVTDTEQNFRLSPATGAQAVGPPASPDTPLAFAPAPDPNAGTNPNVTAAAYTNPVSPAPASTTLFDIDTGVDDLVIQGETSPPGPNGGVLTTVGDLGVTVEDGNGYDIVARFNQGFAALSPTAIAPALGVLTVNPQLFAVNVASTSATPLARANGGAVSSGALGGAAMGTTVAGATVVQDNVLVSAGTPPPVPTPTPTPVPTYVVPTPVPTYVVPTKLKPRITARVKPRRDRRKPFVFRVQGRLKLPAGVSRAAGCKGTVRIIAKKRKKVIGRRRTGIKSTCKYKARVKLRKSAGKRGTVRFRVRFLGNDRLKRASARTSAKYGRPR